LVTGGAGYIGSHMVKFLHQHGYDTVVLDNLSNGHRDAVMAGEFVHGNIGDKALLEELFQQHNFAGVINFASLILVGESVEKPDKYFENNVNQTLVLLEQTVKHGIKNFVFSSSAAVYGDPEYNPIDEDHATKPINPYGETKLIIENELEKALVMRIFNRDFLKLKFNTEKETYWIKRNPPGPEAKTMEKQF